MGGVQTVGLSTGFHSLDSVLGGLRKEALYVLAGRPGMGKTALAFAIALSVAKEGYNVHFLSMEMSAELLALRALSALTKVPSEKIERGLLSKEEFQRVSAARKEVEHVNFDIVGERLESQAFLDHVFLTHSKKPMDLVVIDYVSLCRDENKFGDNERVGRIIENFAHMARVIKAPVIAVAQLNREVEKRENHVPILSDLRDSGAIEQAAFSVLFTYRPYYYEMMFDGAEQLAIEKDAKIIVAKNRQGQAGVQVSVDFIPDQMKWMDKDKIVVRPPRSEG